MHLRIQNYNLTWHAQVSEQIAIQTEAQVEGMRRTLLLQYVSKGSELQFDGSLVSERIYTKLHKAISKEAKNSSTEDISEWRPFLIKLFM